MYYDVSVVVNVDSTGGLLFAGTSFWEGSWATKDVALALGAPAGKRRMPNRPGIPQASEGFLVLGPLRVGCSRLRWRSGLGGRQNRTRSPLAGPRFPRPSITSHRAHPACGSRLRQVAADGRLAAGYRDRGPTHA
jgi:hypothetical protein